MSQPDIQPQLRHLFGRGALYAGASALQVIAALVSVPVLTRLLSTSEYGEYATAAVVAQVLIPVLHLGLPAAITREFFDLGSESARRRMLQLLGVVIAVGSVIGATGDLWSNIFAHVSFGPLLKWTVVLAAAMSAQLGTLAVLRSTDEVGRYISVSAVSALGGPVLGLILVAQRSEAESYVAGLAGATMLSAALGLILAGVRWNRHPRDGFTGALKLGLPTVPHVLAMWAITAGDRVLIERLLGLDDVALYQVAYQAGGVLLLALAAFNNAWGPAIYGETDNQVRWKLVGDLRDTLIETTGLVAAATALLAPLILRLLAPTGYVQPATVKTVALIAACAPLYLIYLIWIRVIFNERTTGVLAVITPTVAILNVAMNLVLIPRLGLIGAAVATLVSYCLLATALYSYASRLVSIPLRSRRATISWGGSSALVAAALLVPTGGPWNALRGLIGFTILTVAAIATRRRVRPEPLRSDATPYRIL